MLLFGWLYTYLFIPETVGLTLEEVRVTISTEITSADRSARSMSCIDLGSNHGILAVGAPARSISTTRRSLSRPRWSRCERRMSRRRRAKPKLIRAEIVAVTCRLVCDRLRAYTKTWSTCNIDVSDGCGQLCATVRGASVHQGCLIAGPQTCPREREHDRWRRRHHQLLRTPGFKYIFSLSRWPPFTTLVSLAYHLVGSLLYHPRKHDCSRTVRCRAEVSP